MRCSWTKTCQVDGLEVLEDEVFAPRGAGDIAKVREHHGKAIGSVADYLIKPVNPNQTLSLRDFEGQGIGHSAGDARLPASFWKAHHGYAELAY